MKFLARGCSEVVEQLTPYPKFEGLNPAVLKLREKNGKMKYFLKFFKLFLVISNTAYDTMLYWVLQYCLDSLHKPVKKN